MKIYSTLKGLALPDAIEFYYKADTGHVYAKYQSDTKSAFVLVVEDKFAADLASFNEASKRAVTSADVNRIITKVYKQALKEAGKVVISPPRYKPLETS